MTEIVIEYNTLSLSQQVLERQRAHAQKISTYLPANADIGDSTGLLLAMFDPMSDVAVDLGVQAATALSTLEGAAAAAVGDTAVDVADQDDKVGDAFSKIISRVGSAPAPGGGGYPDLGGPSLGAAAGGAPDGYGGVDSYFFQKAASTVDSVKGSVSDVGSLVKEVGQWGSPGVITEISDASSFLVPGQAPDNVVADLRWSAGALLGSIDWVAEKFIGFSILQRCVYGPLAGDWQGIYRCSEAWSHSGDAITAIGRNHAGLVASTPATWKGLSGDSFRVAMTTITGACLELSTAFGAAAGLVKTISTVCKGACTVIGFALKTIVDRLIEMAAEAATPVIGWAVGAARAYSNIQKVMTAVKLINTTLELVSSSIQDFVAAKTAITGKLLLIEDLVQGLGTSAVAS